MSETYEEWHERYTNNKYIDVKGKLDEKDLEILRKLNIEIKEELYSEYEIELVRLELANYYQDSDMSEEELETVKSFDGTGVTREEFNNIIDKIDNIF